MPTVTYEGDDTFLDLDISAAGKSEWGMDTLTRNMAGSSQKLAAYIQTLTQGDAYTFNFKTYYLQSWGEPSRRDNAFYTVQLNYKGLIDGIPAPKVSGQTTEQSFSVSATVSGDDYTREASYKSRQSTYLYIRSGRPTGPTYTTLDVNIAPVIFKSVIKKSDGTVYNGATAPAGVVTALTTTPYDDASMQCEPVIGTPYYVCTDTVNRLYPST